MIICLLIPLSTVSASDINTTTADNQVLSATPSVDTLSASVNPEQKNDTLSVQNDENLLSAGTDSGRDNLLGDNDDSGSLSDLNSLIRYTPNTLPINQDYQYKTGDSALTLSKNNYVIDFNGHVIDANGYDGTTFLTITGDNVVIKNLKIINSKATSQTVLWSGANGILDNINISNTENVISWRGDKGILTNSFFSNITQNSASNGIRGGINFTFTNSEIKDCIINDNRVSTLVSLSSDSHLSGLKFNNINQKYNSVYWASTLISLNTSSVIEDCYFNNCSASMIISVYSDCLLSNLSFYNSSNYDTRGMVTVFSSSINCLIKDSKFINCSNKRSAFVIAVNNALSKVDNCTFEGVFQNYALKLSGGELTNSKFINNTGITPLYIITSAGSNVENCTFINNSGSGAGGIYAQEQFFISNCSFIDNVGNDGGAIYISKSLTEVFDCTFINNTATKKGNSIYASNDLNIKINDTGNKWYKDYDWDVYAPNCIQSFYTNLWVNQTGGGDGSEENPMNITEALKLISANGIINFINNGEVYENISETIPVTLTLNGNGVRITTKNKPYVFDINSKSNVKINNFIFDDCVCTSSNSVICISGFSNEINNCTFINCQGETAGAIASPYANNLVLSSNFMISGCNFTGNTAITGSGAILLQSNGATVSDCYFDYNNGITAGAIIVSGYDGIHDIVNCNFTGNTASSGGALVFDRPTNVNYCNFTDNKATNADGGAINANHATSTIGNSNFFGNEALNGGAIYLNTVLKDTMKNCSFENNNAESYGDAIYTSNALGIFNSSFKNNGDGSGSVIYANGNNKVMSIILSNFTDNKDISLNLNKNNGIVDNCIFSSNTCSTIVANDSSVNTNTLSVSYSNFTDNTARDGSSIYSIVKTTISNSNFKYNTAAHNGTVYLKYEGSSVSDSNFTGNNANIGGALYINASNVKVDNNRFEKNNASDIGGAIYVNDDYLTISKSTFLDNNATNDGGAVYVDCSVNTGLHYSLDANSRKTISDVSKLNGIYNMGSDLLKLDVYVILHPEEGSTGEIDNPTSFDNGFKLVAPGGTIWFVNASEVYTNFTGGDNEGQHYGGIQMTCDKEGVKFMGNNTTIVNLRFIANSDNIEIHNMIFKNCSDSVIVWNANNGLIDNCTFIDNGGDSCSVGAAVQVLGENITIQKSNFIGNNVSNSNTRLGGGALYVNNVGFKVVNSSFEDNIANIGSHLFLDSGASSYDVIVLIENCTFKEGNKIDSNGQGIIINCNNVYITDSKFISNNDGAISLPYYVEHVIIKNNTFEENTADNGGAILVTSDSNPILVSISENNFTGNNASLNGGALCILSGSFSSLDYNNFTDNNALNGGAFYIGVDNINLNYCNFVENNATLGGALYVAADNTNVWNSNFIGNTANTIESYGSAIYIEDDVVFHMHNGELKDNHVFGEDSDMKRADISFGNVGPNLIDVEFGSSPYTQYAYNRTPFIYATVFISNNGMGTGFSSDNPTTLSKVLETGIKDNGFIYLVGNEDIVIDESTLKNINNLKIVNYNDGKNRKIKLNDNDNKYLFNQPKNAKNKKKLCKNISFQLIIYPPI